MKVFVVAITQKEADELAKLGYGHLTSVEAQEHLREVRAAPTDHFYASQYSVYMAIRD